MRHRPAGLESVAAGGDRGHRRAARSFATEADSVTTARSTSRPPQRTQTRRSLSKVRFNKVRQSMRVVAAYSSPSRRRSQSAMQRTFGATCSALPVVVGDEVTTASTASRRKTALGQRHDEQARRAGPWTDQDVLDVVDVLARGFEARLLEGENQGRVAACALRPAARSILRPARPPSDAGLRPNHVALLIQEERVYTVAALSESRRVEQIGIVEFLSRSGSRPLARRSELYDPAMRRGIVRILALRGVAPSHTQRARR
jgi:hypothetical protein